MSMTREEAIEFLGQYIDNDCYTDKCQDAHRMALTALRGPTREMVEGMRGHWMHKEVQSNNSLTGYFKLPECECSNCGCIVQQEANFCPRCGEPKTAEAVDMMLKRMEEMTNEPE